MPSTPPAIVARMGMTGWRILAFIGVTNSSEKTKPTLFRKLARPRPKKAIRCAGVSRKKKKKRCKPPPSMPDV